MLKFLNYILILIFLSGCQNSLDNSICKFDTKNLLIGNSILKIKIACSDKDKATGLMFKNELNTDEGMLFVFPSLGFYNFWMKDTKIPLSIVFINKDWQIVDIKEMLPLDKNTITSKTLALYAIEANSKWFQQHQVSIGTQIYLKN